MYYALVKNLLMYDTFSKNFYLAAVKRNINIVNFVHKTLCLTKQRYRSVRLTSEL